VEVLRQEGKEEKVPKLLWNKNYKTPGSAKNGSISPMHRSIYTYDSKSSTYGLSTTPLPRHSIYASSKVICSPKNCLWWSEGVFASLLILGVLGVIPRKLIDITVV